MDIVWESVLDQMARVSRCTVLLKNIWSSRRNNFHSWLHYTRQNIHIHFSDRFLILKKMWWHDITLTGHNTSTWTLTGHFVLAIMGTSSGSWTSLRSFLRLILASTVKSSAKAFDNCGSSIIFSACRRRGHFEFMTVY